LFKKLFTFTIILLIVLFVLTIGENIGAALLEWISAMLGVTIKNISDLINVITAYVLRNPIKSIIGVIISLLIMIFSYSDAKKTQDDE
jgi:hypothetical protein